MRYLIKPFEVKNTNNLGFGRTTSYVAEVVEGEILLSPKTVGTLGVQAQINVGIYSLEVDENGGFDINNAKLQEVRSVKETGLTQAGISLTAQQQIFAGLVFGDLKAQETIVAQLIAGFGLELA